MKADGIMSESGVRFAVEGSETISKDEQVHSKRGLNLRTPWKRGRSNIGNNHSNVYHVEPAAPAASTEPTEPAAAVANTPKSILKNSDPLASSNHDIALPNRVSSDEAKKVSWDANIKENNKFSFGRLNKAVLNNFKGMVIGLDKKVHQAREKMQCGNMAAAKDFYCAGDGGGNIVMQTCKRCEGDLSSLAMNDLMDDESDSAHDQSEHAVVEAREDGSESRESETGCVEMREDENMGMVTLVYNDPEPIHPRRSAPVTRKFEGGRETMTTKQKKASQQGKRNEGNRRYTTRQPKQRKKGLKGALTKPIKIMTVGMKMNTRNLLTSNERYEM